MTEDKTLVARLLHVIHVLVADALEDHRLDNGVSVVDELSDIAGGLGATPADIETAKTLPAELCDVCGVNEACLWIGGSGEQKAYCGLKCVDADYPDLIDKRITCVPPLR